MRGLANGLVVLLFRDFARIELLSQQFELLFEMSLFAGGEALVALAPTRRQQKTCARQHDGIAQWRSSAG